MIVQDARIDRQTETGQMLAQFTASMIASLEAEGVKDPLGLQLTVACVLTDLYHAAGEPLPYEIALRIEGERAGFAVG